MDIVDSPELIDQLYDWLGKRVEELTGPRSSAIHLTELIYCLTSSYWRRLHPLGITKQQALTMGLGIGLERMFVPEDMRAEPDMKDGIAYSPDFFWLDKNRPAELKTTRMGSKKTHTREFPETWIEQIKGYCYAQGMLMYALGIVHLLGNYRPPFPEILGVTIKFNQQELQENWSYLLFRKEALISAFAEQKPPTPRRWCKDWECKYCQYVKRCDNWLATQVVI